MQHPDQARWPLSAHLPQKGTPLLQGIWTLLSSHAQLASPKRCGSCCAEFRSAKKGKTGSDRRRPGHPLRNENQLRLQAAVMTEALKFPYSVQGRGTVESIGNHFYRVCGPAGCTVVMGLSNALYLSRNVPESASPADP